MPNRDQHAILLLTAHFGGSAKGDFRPLGPKEWGEFAQWLRAAGHRPGDLVNGTADQLLADWSHPKITTERLRFLLARGSAMALALEKWERAGIWVLTRGDENYPTRLKKRLGASAPPVFFGCGNQRLLSQGGVAFVGSRKASDGDLAFTREVAGAVTGAGHSVVSGGARGVDEVAMLAALEAEGTVVGVLADSLLRAVSSSKYRKALRGGDMALISPYQPEARFQVGNAMGRNKYIYCLADAAVIVTCEEGSGGTWSGATEALKHEWVPVWVRSGPDRAGGNAALESKGARGLPDSGFEVNRLFDTDQFEATSAEPAMTLPNETVAISHAEDPVSQVLTKSEDAPQPMPSPYEAFLAHLEDLIVKRPMAVKDIQAEFELETTQTRKWLERAQGEGRIEKVSKNPIKYQWLTESAEQTSMFS